MIKYIDFAIEHMEIEHSSCFGGVCPMTKTASDRNLLGKVAQKKDHAYLHVIAMGAGDYYGENNNGDFFYEKDLIDYYKTFDTAGIFVQHFNKDPSKSIGTVIVSDYNMEMHRVELVLEISKAKSPEHYDRIKSGERMSVSMGVKVPQEMCSYCGAITKGTLANRCEHLKFMMHQQQNNGQVVYAINLPPMLFFDISIVAKPADSQGHALFQKVASDQSHGDKTREDMIQEKIASLVKRVEAIDSLPSAVSDDELHDIRSHMRPEMLRRIIVSRRLSLKPSEALFLGSDMHKDDLPGCRETCDNADFIGEMIRKISTMVSCSSLSKEASDVEYSNAVFDKLAARTTLIKHASWKENGVKTDFFGNRRVASTALMSKSDVKKSVFAAYRVNMYNGENMTIPKGQTVSGASLSNYYLDMVDSGNAENIMGILPNGDEKVIYRR